MEINFHCQTPGMIKIKNPGIVIVKFFTPFNRVPVVSADMGDLSLQNR